MENWYTWVLIFILCIFMTGCMSEEDQALLNEEVAKYKNLADEVTQLVNDAKEGIITIPEMALLIDAKKVQMTSSLEVIKDIQSKGISTWEIVFWSVLSAAGIRGVPSKGPLRGAYNMIFARKPD